MLTIPSGILTDLDAGRVRLFDMVKFTLPSGTTGLWNGDESLSFESVTYGGIAGNLVIEEISSSTGLNIDALSVKISGLVPAAINMLRSLDWHQAPATCYRAFVDRHNVVSHAQIVFVGFLDTAPISDAAGDTFLISANLETYNRELDRAMGRVSSDSDQRNVGGATDGLNKWKSAAATKSEIYWGRAGPQSPVG